MIFSLIEKGSSLLSVAEVVEKGDAVFFSQNFFGHFALQDADFLFKAFEQTHFGIVALEDAFGRELLDQDFAEKALIAFTGLAERLDNEVISVGIDDDGGQQVGFAIDQAIRVGIFDDGFSIGRGSADALGEKSAVDGNVFAREQADGDLRFVAVKRGGEIGL